MEIIKNNKGKGAGRVSVLNTIATMDVDEVWVTSSEEVDFAYTRQACSVYGRVAGRRFSVSSPVEAAGQITVTRVQ